MDIPLTITETQKGLVEKKFSAVELVGAYLARINTFDGDINSFITVSDDLAYEQAKNADKLIQQLGIEAIKQFPLLGVVTAYKDIFLTKGIRTTAASKVLESYIPQYNATSVERLEQAGAICIGKTNLDAWAHGSSGENSDFGATKNPWNKEYVSGGSSSGAGAALSANFALLTTGTDTCGSIRLPANYNGVVGLKPTYGSVSRYGIVAMASSLDSIGHLTRSVEDLKTVFTVTKGTDAKDGTVFDNNQKAKNNEHRKWKIGIPKEFFGEGLDEEVRKSIDGVIEYYKKYGVEFVDVSLPHTKYGISVYYIIQPAEVSSNLGRYDGIRYGNDRSEFGDEAKRRIMLGSYVLSSGYYDAYYLKAMKVRTIICSEVNKTFEKVDAMIAPVAPTPPFKLGAKADDPLQMYLTDIFAATANLSGIPALAIPSGFTKSGLPLGFQLMGPRFGEETLFDLGEMYQKETDWHLKTAKL
jgi:aspartyl-tRNA(Asn)/glutamyl-tRNA(Gln) amidotransferase subunit A